MRVENLVNYEIKEHKFLSDINTDAYYLIHKKTGARVVIMPNDVENKVFYIGFRTPPKDSTGVAHIVEHTVLCGSDKYPIKDPFVELCKGSLNTFLNAMTYPDKTLYPVASCNDFDFKNLMDVYLDAVFHPNIYKEEKIFRQEGWHYDMSDADDDLKINGVVYSEMKGAFSDPDDIFERQIMNSLFPDTPYGVESGGDPDVIPELTYNDFLEFHSKYYHPSNSYIFLYGNCDMAERLEYIDKEYLSKYEKIQIESQIASQKPFDKAIECVSEYPVTENDSLENKTYLNLTYCLNDYSDKEMPIVLRALDYAFSGNPAAPLRKAVLEAGIGNEFYTSADSSLKQNCFGFYVKGANESDKEKFLEIIDKEIKRTVKEGFDKKTLLAFLVREEFKYREADFGRLPKGLAYGIDLLDSWLYDDNLPFLHVENLETYKFLKDAVSTDYFEKILEKYFINNNHKSVCVAVPVKGLTTIKENKLAEELKKIKESLSKEEIEKIVKETEDLKLYQESEDAIEDLEKIKLLKVSDIKKEIRPNKCRLHDFNGLKFLKQDIYTSGIAYLTFFFDITDMPLDDMRYIPLLTSMMGRMDTEYSSYGDISNEIKLNTGGLNVVMATQKHIKTDKISVYVELNAKFLYENRKKVFDIFKEVILKSNFDDDAKIKEYLSEIRSQGESMLISSAHTVALTRATSYIDEKSVIGDICNGIDSVSLIRELDDNPDESVKLLKQKFKKLVPLIFRKDNILINLVSPLDKQNILDDDIKDFIDSLYEEKPVFEKEKIELNKGNEGFIFPGQVQYVAEIGEYKSKGYSYNGAFCVLKTILGYDYLWNNVRVKGGAYGCFASFSYAGTCSLVSYRDPHIKNTLKIYRGLAEFVKNFECSDRQMNQFIIGAISDLDMPQTPYVEGKSNCAYFMGGLEDSDRQKIRDEILSCDSESIRALAGHIEAAFSKENVCVIGSEAKIKENESLFIKVRNLID